MKNKKVKAGKLPKPKKVKLLGKDFIELSHKVADILEEEGRIPKQEKAIGRKTYLCACGREFDWLEDMRKHLEEVTRDPFNEPPKEKECNYKDWYKLQMYTDNPDILEPLRKGKYKGLIDELVVWREEPPKESCVCPSCDYSKNNCRDCDYCKEKKEEPSMEELIDMATHGDTRLVKSKLKPKESCKCPPYAITQGVHLGNCLSLESNKEKKESWRDELQGIFLKPWTSKDIEAFIEKQIDSVKAQAYKDIMTIRKNGEEMSKITIERLEREIKEAREKGRREGDRYYLDAGPDDVRDIVKEAKRDVIEKIEKAIRMERWEDGKWIKSGVIIETKNWFKLKKEILGEENHD